MGLLLKVLAEKYVESGDNFLVGFAEAWVFWISSTDCMIKDVTLILFYYVQEQYIFIKAIINVGARMADHDKKQEYMALCFI